MTNPDSGEQTSHFDKRQPSYSGLFEKTKAQIEQEALLKREYQQRQEHNRRFLKQGENLNQYKGNRKEKGHTSGYIKLDQENTPSFADGFTAAHLEYRDPDIAEGYPYGIITGPNQGHAIEGSLWLTNKDKAVRYVVTKDQQVFKVNYEGKDNLGKWLITDEIPEEVTEFRFNGIISYIEGQIANKDAGKFIKK